jgi:hypothetical protein
MTGWQNALTILGVFAAVTLLPLFRAIDSEIQKLIPERLKPSRNISL